MGKVTITFEDTDVGFETSVDFDPPAKASDEMGLSANAAMIALAAVQSAFGEGDVEE